MNERIKELLTPKLKEWGGASSDNFSEELEKFAELIVRKCVDKIETHRIPVGNSAAGEMACEWTYSALMEIRDEIKEHFGVKNESCNK
jgi:hypothetical protein